jgi:outer membrane protein
MKRLLTIKMILAIISLVALGAGAHYVWRIYEKNMRVRPLSQAQIAFVDLKRVRDESLGSQKFKELIERQYKQFQDEIQIQEKTLHEQYDQIKEAKIKELGEAISPKTSQALQKQKEDFERNLNELNTTIRQRKESLNQDFAKIEENIEKTIIKIVETIAHKRKLNLVFNATVLDTSVILYGGQELDITDDIIAELNKQIPTVHLGTPQS